MVQLVLLSLLTVVLQLSVLAILISLALESLMLLLELLLKATPGYCGWK